MLRTILSRNQVASNSLKKAIRPNVTRSLSSKDDKTNLRLCSLISSGLARRKYTNRLTASSSKTVLGAQWSIQTRKYSSLPSHQKVNLPALSPTMESGSIVKWEKKEGDKLNEGDLLCEIETDKATMGFETPEEGYLAKILIPAGTKGVAVGKLLCIIVEDEGDVAAFKDFKDDGSHDVPMGGKSKEKEEEKPAAAEAAPPSPPPKPAAPSAPAPSAQKAPSKEPASDGRVYASPMARRLAEIRNVRLGGKGSGLYGSLKSGDLAEAGTQQQQQQQPAAPTPGASYIDIPLTSMRETIAKRLSLSKQTVPHYQLTMTVNVEKTLAMRKAVNERLDKSGVKVSMNDFIIKAVAAAAKKVPSVNSYWMETYIRQFSNVDVSVAVATPNGLITPIIFNADSRGVIDISKSMKELAQKAKEGRLTANEYQGGTITVSNLGMFGITMFNAIINPPQSFILAVGGLQELAVPDKDGGFKIGKFISLTASADHRVTDGAVGAQFMKELKDNLEDPANIIL